MTMEPDMALGNSLGPDDILLLAVRTDHKGHSYLHGPFFVMAPLLHLIHML